MRYVAPHETKQVFACPTKTSRLNRLGMFGSLMMLQKPAVRQPFLEAFDPFAGGFGVVRPQAKAVATSGQLLVEG